MRTNSLRSAQNTELFDSASSAPKPPLDDPDSIDTDFNNTDTNKFTRAPNETKNEWSTRYMNLLASDLVYNAIKAEKSSNRKGSLLRAVKRIGMIANFRKTVIHSRELPHERAARKNQLKKEIFQRKSTGKTMQLSTDKNKPRDFDLGPLETLLEGNPKVPITCSCAAPDYLSFSTNFLYQHSLAISTNTNGFSQEADSWKISCPGCGKPMHYHSISEVLQIENAILEEYVRLARREGRGGEPRVKRSERSEAKRSDTIH